MERIKKVGRFELDHKIISFSIIIFLTIIITRILTSIKNPNPVIGGFEIHHFYYGLLGLIIISLVMLFRKGNFKFNLIMTAVSIGLIVDELLLIGLKTTKTVKYSSTLDSAIIFAIIILFIVEFIFYFLKKK